MHLKSFGGGVYAYFQQKAQPSSHIKAGDKPLRYIDFKGDGILNHVDFKARVIAKKAFDTAKGALPPKIYAEFVQEAKELMETQNVEISQLEDKFAVLLQNKIQIQESLKNLKDTVGMSFEEKLISIFGIQESLQELAKLSNKDLLAKIGEENKEDFLKILYEERNHLPNDTEGKIGNKTLINAIILQLGGDIYDYQMISDERKMLLDATMNFKSSDSLIVKSSFDSLNKFTKNKLVKQYMQKYPKIATDIKAFFDMSFNNTFTRELSEFNINNFDTKDKKRGLSKYEREQFTQRIDTAMNQMNLLGGFDSFEEKYREISNPEFSVSQWDIAVSNALDFQEFLLGEGKTHFTENAHNYSEEELHKMREEMFDITDMDSMKNFIILLGIELGDGIEDVLRFLGNILAVIPVQKRYWNNRSILSHGGIDTKDKAVAQMENEILLKENPSLMLCELLGEKGVQMIEELGNMMTSGKNGDIAMMLVTIAGLLAGGAGAVKFAAKTAKMSKTAEVAGKIQKAASKVDDIVGGAGIGHLTGEFSKKGKATEVGNSRVAGEEAGEAETLKAINVSLEEMRVALNTETDLAKKKQIEQAMIELRKEKIKREKGEEVVKVVEKNAELSDTERIQKTEELTGKKLSKKQKEAVLYVHNNISKGIYANDRATLKKMTVELKKAGFESSEIRVMMEKGVLGKILTINEEDFILRAFNHFKKERIDLFTGPNKKIENEADFLKNLENFYRKGLIHDNNREEFYKYLSFMIYVDPKDFDKLYHLIKNPLPDPKITNHFDVKFNTSGKWLEHCPDTEVTNMTTFFEKDYENTARFIVVNGNLVGHVKTRDDSIKSFFSYINYNGLKKGGIYSLKHGDKSLSEIQYRDHIEVRLLRDSNFSDLEVDIGVALMREKYKKIKELYGEPKHTIHSYNLRDKLTDSFSIKGYEIKQFLFKKFQSDIHLLGKISSFDNTVLGEFFSDFSLQDLNFSEGDIMKISHSLMTEPKKIKRLYSEFNIPLTDTRFYSQCSEMDSDMENFFIELFKQKGVTQNDKIGILEDLYNEKALEIIKILEEKGWEVNVENFKLAKEMVD